jgi:hypothetical protein
MTRFYKKGCTLLIVDNSSLTKEQVEQLKMVILEVTEVLVIAIGASSAPRHGNPDRDEFVAIRRKWFGKKRGRVRHTFKDIEDFLKNGGNSLTISTKGSRCEPGAHAYTPESQEGGRREIFLCDKFFEDDAAGQISTLIHELTHLIRNTEDFDVSVSDELDFKTTLDVISVRPESIRASNKAFFQNDLEVEERARSAYNFEYFITDLINECYEGGLPDPVKRSS